MFDLAVEWDKPRQSYPEQNNPDNINELVGIEYELSNKKIKKIPDGSILISDIISSDIEPTKITDIERSNTELEHMLSKVPETKTNSEKCNPICNIM